jgi:tetratricopeptide (TPR) repeat protein
MLALQGVALLGSGRPSYALPIFEQAVSLSPSKALYLRLAQTREILGDLIGGLYAREEAAKLGAPDARELYGLGHAQEVGHRFAAARETFRKLLEGHEKVPEFARATARLERIGGDRETAGAILDRAREGSPEEPRILADRIALGGAGDEATGLAERLIGKEDLPLGQRRGLAFALTGHFDRAEDEEKAWHFATLGNGLYTTEGQTVELAEASIEDAFSRERTIEALPATEDMPKLIYLLGAPRTGGTLLQTVLAAAPDAASMGERGALMSWLTAADADLWQQQAEAVRLADIKGMRSIAPGASVMIDKTTHHAHVAGLIAKLHPGAVLIEQKRDPMDTLVSVFLHNFRDAFGFTRKPVDIADYLSLHSRTLDRWRAEGVGIETIDYDTLVADPSAEGEKLFGLTGQPWKESYLDEANRSAEVRTFSIDQARGPIAKPERSRGERYAAFLKDLPDDALKGLQDA